MARKPESLLYDRLRDNLKDCYITRVESSASLGFPDCLIGIDRKFVTVELKVARSRKVLLSPHQVSWHMKHAAGGLPCWIFVQVTAPRFALEFRLYAGGQASELLFYGLALDPVDTWPVKSANWEHIRRRLIE